MLPDSRRAAILAALDRRAIRPWFDAIANNVWFTTGPDLNNWHTVIACGFGILGMALGDKHPRSPELIAQADRIVAMHARMFGPKGESNESPGYSGATRVPVHYLNARRFHDAAAGRPAANPFLGHPYQHACHWMIHQLCPPGRMVAYGDTHLDALTKYAFFATVADAARDPSIQAAFLHLCRVAEGAHGSRGGEHAIADLLTFNPDIPARLELPLGKAYRGHSACITSRSSWDLDTCRIVVCGKGGHGSEGHGNHDAGQLLIDAHAERLIVDCGIPQNGYPPDFFGPNRYHYYNASVRGHNVFMFDRREMRTGAEHAASILHAEFDPARLGGCWQLDTTPLYDGARCVRRHVIHCGDVVAVLDEAELDAPAAISMRWHTIAPPILPGEPPGSFQMQGKTTLLSGRIIRLDGPLDLAIRRHEYHPPYDRNRIGVTLTQCHEPYLEATCFDRRCRLLTLFCISDPGAASMPPWTGENGTYRMHNDSACTVTVTDRSIEVTRPDLPGPWQLQQLPA